MKIWNFRASLMLAATLAVMLSAFIASTAEANRNAFLGAHNSYRAKHCTAPLAWSSNLASSAQSWANRLASECRFALRHSKPVGENAWAGEGRSYSVNEMVRAWYVEERNYSYGSARSNGRGIIGHFTQMVWAGSRKVGCGVARCGNKSYAICQYHPAGNYVGHYHKNVKPRCR